MLCYPKEDIKLDGMEIFSEQSLLFHSCVFNSRFCSPVARGGWEVENPREEDFNQL